ncbi:hypothetical protein XA68_13838 [Ophiocordyceps unilateralis]|uniref:DNA-binding protein RAP1 n=1 Tax=Ophiocordyceps unilateralis TaxID=268505 RepID=A0A2A9PM04_OPHUN|nr:hypothetical protein XA68_13838 [Ophiocordyceps unilateralis]
MSHITYNDVASAQGGNIFEGKRFWVAIRVPSRPRIVDLITSNGGIMETLEKNADFLIADPARKDAPQSSYSYELISDSVEHGIMQLEDRYSIDRTQASSKMAKNTRTPFTHADEVVLSRWIIKNERNLQGNKIYQELEKLHPQHPWQSWKMRLANEELPEVVCEPSGIVTRPNVAPTPSKTPPRENDEASEGRSGESQMDNSAFRMDNFYRAFEEFYHDRGIQANDIQIQYRIGDKLVGLWELSNAVCGQKALPEQVDWKRVANEFCQEWEFDEQICADLQRCYEEKIAAFVEHLKLLPGDDGNIDQQPMQQSPEGPARPSPLSTLPSTPPPQTPGRKRPREADTVDSDREVKWPRRLGRDVEIPSTPEGMIGLARSLPAAIGASSTNEEPARLDWRSETQQNQDSPTASQQLLSEAMLSETPSIHPTPVRQHNRCVSEQAAITATHHDRAKRNLSESVISQANTKASRRTLPSSFGSTARRSPPGQRRQKQPQSRVGSGSGSGSRKGAPSGEQAIMEKVQHYVSLGYPERIVIKALMSTSMRPGGAAAHTMQSLKEGKGIPTNVENAWTKRDDRDLLWADSVKAREASASVAELKKAGEKHERLDHKHRQENLELRRRFLKDLTIVMSDDVGGGDG